MFDECDENDDNEVDVARISKKILLLLTLG